MPFGRPSKDINEYKDEISKRFLDGEKIETIAEHLLEKYNIKVHPRTIQRRLKDWGIVLRVRSLTPNSQLDNRIKKLFFENGLSDKEIIYVLHREGIQITPHNLTSTRLRLGLRRRLKREDIENTEAAVKEAVQKDLNNGRIEGYGRGHLYTHFRSLEFNIGR